MVRGGQSLRKETWAGGKVNLIFIKYTLLAQIFKIYKHYILTKSLHGIKITPDQDRQPVGRGVAAEGASPAVSGVGGVGMGLPRPSGLGATLGEAHGPVGPGGPSCSCPACSSK